MLFVVMAVFFREREREHWSLASVYNLPVDLLYQEIGKCAGFILAIFLQLRFLLSIFLGGSIFSWSTIFCVLEVVCSCSCFSGTSTCNNCFIFLICVSILSSWSLLVSCIHVVLNSGQKLQQSHSSYILMHLRNTTVLITSMPGTLQRYGPKTLAISLSRHNHLKSYQIGERHQF